MQNIMVSDDDVRLLKRAKKEAELVRESATYLCQRLESFFANDSFEGVGLEFHPKTQGRSVCDIRTPCGLGRMVLDYAVGERGLIGVGVVERQRFNCDDSPLWKPVFTIMIPAGEENPFVQDADRAHGIYIYAPTGEDQYWLSVRNLGLSIFKAIVSGPKSI